MSRVAEAYEKVLDGQPGHPASLKALARIAEAKGAYDAILLDVDNGPEGLTRKSNDWLYTEAGAKAAFAALKPAGLLAVWSAGPDMGFARRLRGVGFAVEEIRVRARGPAGGSRHTIWIAARG